MTTQEQPLVDRLRIRASIRRSIPSRKSVQEGKPDRIANLLEEAADMIDDQWSDIQHMQEVIERLHEENDWISVKDALPEKYRECLIYPWISDYILTAELQSDGWCYTEYIAGYGAEVHTLPKGRITHWMYLPGEPKQE